MTKNFDERETLLKRKERKRSFFKRITLSQGKRILLHRQRTREIFDLSFRKGTLVMF